MEELRARLAIRMEITAQGSREEGKEQGRGRMDKDKLHGSGGNSSLLQGTVLDCRLGSTSSLLCKLG